MSADTSRFWLRSRLTAGYRALLGWSDIADTMIVGILARSGCDALLLDLQHGYHDTASCLAAIGEATLARCPVLVRVPVGDYASAGKFLDFGAAGTVAPMISSAAEARAFVSQVKYPPLGQRSFGPSRAMQLAGEASAAAFVAEANAATLALVMIETREAVDALDEILSVLGVDGVLLGPGDLSISLTQGRFAPEGPEVGAALDRIAACCAAQGKIACAFGGSLDRANLLFEKGFDLVSVAYDVEAIETAFGQIVKSARGYPHQRRQL